MENEIERAYDSESIEKKWYPFWEENGFFTAGLRKDREAFCIVIPPPNVTGSLHIGHALNSTLQDIVIRRKRMEGYDTLWLPGMDHAGIATQVVVEKQLAREGKSRQEAGREEFVRRVWQWKAEKGGRIVEQLKRLGASCDWTRMRFTLDEGLSKAVRTVFVTLFREGLIYRGNYIVNWCPRCLTALSDLEVEHKEVHGNLWTLRYPLKGGGGAVEVATTRPETMLGDTAVAVNPEDERYRSLIGRTVVLPFLHREIPIIADPFVDREFGTGAVKITPAHDPNDFLAARRHDLPAITVMDEKAVMNENAGPFKGLDRFECREKIVADLRQQGLLVRIDDHLHAVGHCYRCQSMSEPYLSTQWFVKMKPLAEPAVDAVRRGRVRFVPDKWEKVYFDWMDNIHDWCISRQLWWGHRIPAHHCRRCGEISASNDAVTACAHCGSPDIVQDPDVLDTWFSSALWPFSTLGWPDRTEDLRRFYPTSVMITGYDILFFWVARMIMMGLKFAGDVPFRDVYITTLIRDELKQKMSKSKGNVIDPVEQMDLYGADTVRLTLAIMAMPLSDVSLSDKRMAGYRTFMNKLWQAFRFVSMHLDGAGADAAPLSGEGITPADRWIVSRLNQTALAVNEAMDAYRFYEAADLLYHFVWHEFCDWYLELAKPHLREGEKSRASRAVLVETMDSILRLLHPFIPFVTEELWQKLPGRGPSITTASYPRGDRARVDKELEASFETVLEVIKEIRRIRAEKNIEPAARPDLVLATPDAARRGFLAQGEEYIRKLARVESVAIHETSEGDISMASGSAGGVHVRLSLGASADREEEKNRLENRIRKIESEMAVLQNRLQDRNFVDRAPGAVVEKNRESLRKLEETLAHVREARDAIDAGRKGD
jgi:valyl-tRNA synthetase